MTFYLSSFISIFLKYLLTNCNSCCMISNVSGRYNRHNNLCASGSVGGARPCQGRGRGFESRLALSFMERTFDGCPFLIYIFDFVLPVGRVIVRDICSSSGGNFYTPLEAMASSLCFGSRGFFFLLQTRNSARTCLIGRHNFSSQVPL